MKDKVAYAMAQQKPTALANASRKRHAAPGRLLSQRNVVIGFVVVCMAALLVFGIRIRSRANIAATDRADAANAALVARGTQVYTTRCASCHGSDLKGEQGWPQRRPNGAMPAPPLDQSGVAWQQNGQWLFSTIKQGGQATAPPGTASSMPALGGLTDADIWAIISYLKSTWPSHIQNPQPR